MRRLICVFRVRICHNQVFPRRGSSKTVQRNRWGGYLMDKFWFRDNFLYFSIKTNVVGIHQKLMARWFYETHNSRFYGEILGIHNFTFVSCLWKTVETNPLITCTCIIKYSPVSLRYGGARWLSGRVSDSGARGPGFETYRRRVVSLSKTLYSPKVLVNYPGSDGSVPKWLKNCWLGR